MKFTSLVSNVEIYGSFLVWSGTVLYSLYKVGVASSALALQNDYGLSTGWAIFNGRKKDYSDYDWEFTKYIYVRQITWICIHLIISEVLRWMNYIKLIPLAQIAITIICLIFSLNISIFLIFFQPILFGLFMKFENKYYIWILEIAFLIFLKIYRSYEYLSYYEHSFNIVSLYWINLKCLSYSISNLHDISKRNSKRNILNLLSYCLYLPLFVSGPFIDFECFLKSHEPIKATLFNRITKLCVGLTRFIFWIIVAELAHHFVYSSAISLYPKLVEKFDYWTLYGLGYSIGQYFHLNYVVCYGISTTLAKFENIPAPNIPKCVGRIHLYSDMWRYFDSGLYIFLVRYIYVPLLKMEILPVLASLICFCFVFVWHGMTNVIFLWSFLNFLCVTIESTFSHLYTTYCKKQCEKYLNEAWIVRISCMLAALLYPISVISNFYFLAGINIGNIFWKRYFAGDLQMYIILLFSVYCCCQISIYTKQKTL